MNEQFQIFMSVYLDVFIFYKISISMDKKEGIIHLGRTKSPQRTLYPPVHVRINSLRSSKDKQNVRDSDCFNNTYSTPFQERGFVKQASKTADGFISHSPKSSNPVIVKDQTYPNRNSLVHTSPVKRIIVSRPVPVHQEDTVKVSAPQLVHSPDAGQLMMKIKVLEGRVQELHKEKQISVLRTHEENKKLVEDNNALRNRLKEVEILKNQEINSLKHELTLVRNSANCQRVSRVQVSQKPCIPQKMKFQPNECMPIVNSSLKNIAYTEDDQNQNIPSIQQIQEQPQPLKQAQILKSDPVQGILNGHQIFILQREIQRLNEQNQYLKACLEEIKESITENTSVIESNSSEIVSNYENKIAFLEAELMNFRKGQDRIRSLEQSVNFYKASVEEYVQRNLEKSQKFMRDQEMYKKNIAKLEARLKQSEQFEHLAMEKSKLVQIIVNSTHCLPSFCEAETQTEDPKLSQSCNKCRQLVKTLMKLNQFSSAVRNC